MISKLRLRLQRWHVFMSVTVLTLLLIPYTQERLHAADGNLDLTFGTNGKVTTDFASPSDEAAGVVVQADGKIVVAGTTVQSTSDFALARYNADGTLDATFGTGGKVTTDFNGLGEVGRALAIQGDGKIVVVGQTTNASGFEDFALARYNTDGSLDTTFGTGGLVVTDFGEVLFEHAVAVTIQSDGRIVAAGKANFSIAVARYLADGSLDASFDGDGLVLSSVGGPSFSLSGMALQANGRIVVTGSVPTPGGVLDDFAVVRFKTDGSLDTSLGGAGIVTTDFASGIDIPTAVAIQGDGKIVVSGFMVDLAVFDTRFAVARFNEDGSLDAAFGSAGKVTTDIEGTLDIGSALALQADGKIVVVGSTGAGAASRDIAVARYDTDGTLDPTFGVGGTVTTDIVGAVDFGFAVAIQADGRIVVAARMDLGPAKGGSDFGLVRYEGPAPHELTLFLHGFDVPGTTGGFTMNLTPPAPHVFASQTNAVSWFSDPIVNGALLTGAAFQITLPCTGGVAQAMTVRLSSADAAGRSEQVLGEVISTKKLCQSQTIRMPVTTPATFAQRRLKLTLTSTLPVLPPLHLGPQTFVSATRFVGAP